MSNEPSYQVSRSEQDSRRGRSASSAAGWEGRNRPGGTRQHRRGEEGRRRQPPVKLEAIDWKDVRTLRPFLDDAGRIRPRRKTGASVKMQRAIARAVKRARFMALLPYTSEHIRTTGKEE